MSMASKHWEIDSLHSDIEFKVRNLLISNVTGHFRIFKGTMDTPVHDDFTDAHFTLSLDIYSIDSNNIDRDEHLKSPEFFGADEFPEVTFASTSFTKVDGDKHLLTGNLTLKGVTKEVTFDVLFGGQAKDGFGVDRAGFEFSGTINRKDFGINADSFTAEDVLVLGEEIKILANIQFVNIVDE